MARKDTPDGRTAPRRFCETFSGPVCRPVRLAAIVGTRCGRLRRATGGCMPGSSHVRTDGRQHARQSGVRGVDREAVVAVTLELYLDHQIIRGELPLDDGQRPIDVLNSAKDGLLQLT